MGLSLGFHIPFTALGIGLPLFLLIAEGLALRTGNQAYRNLAKRWARVAAMLFAVGAVTGTILSFEFGLLWPSWIKFSGGVIGFPFALEGFAFFTEAIFLALYVYGWDKLSPRAHWLCTIPMTISSALSAFFVISSNGWMNQPAGFVVQDGKAVAIDPVKAMFNPAMPYEVAHGTLVAYVVTGFVIAGIYAVMMLRGNRSEQVKKALALGVAVGTIAMVLQVISGDLSARFLAHNEPEKFAAMEAQFETVKGAPLRIGGLPNPDAGTTQFAIEIPGLASFLAFENTQAEVRGLNSFPADEIPNVFLVHFPFQIMVGVGFLLLIIGILFWAVVWRRRRIEPGRPLLWALVASLPLSFIALEMGWFVTEFGRQPWIIYRLMRTGEGATPREGIAVLFLLFLLVYVALAAGVMLLLLRERRRPIDTAATGGSRGS
jgi:cytochrome d ubiquinol oxidase subunit I